jgi:hypothetical protein
VRRLALGVAVIATLFLAGCGESEQVVVYKQGKYQGKPDARPWQSEPLTLTNGGGAKWTQGDRAGWEAAINARTLAQHEHKRIYNQ